MREQALLQSNTVTPFGHQGRLFPFLLVWVKLEMRVYTIYVFYVFYALAARSGFILGSHYAFYTFYARANNNKPSQLPLPERL